VKVRILYRVRQFWQCLIANPKPKDYHEVSRVLSADLMDLFSKLHRSEQAHGLWIYRKLLEQGETHQDLLVAALLHDIGKDRYPLRLWQRVAIVLSRKLSPERARHWGQDDPKDWKSPFVVAERHATWGAEMVMCAGASETTVSLIHRHHESLTQPINNPEDQLLYRLQFLDDKS
jgi:hypothetical protein